MIKFEFSLSEKTDSVHEFDMGSLTITFDGGSITSKGKQPNQDMMIFVASSDLLCGIHELVRSKKKQYDFIGADSSYKISFKKMKKDNVELIHEGKSVGIFSGEELLASIYNAVKELHDSYSDILEGTGAAKEDLEYALNKVK